MANYQTKAAYGRSGISKILTSLSKFKVTNSNNFTIKEKCIYCVLIVLLLQALGCLPAPFLNAGYAKIMIGGGMGGAAFGIWDAMTGHGLSKMSLMALSITPYITASIVLQLLTVSSERISSIMQDKTSEGTKTRWKLNAALSAVLALTEGLAAAYGYGRQGVFANTRWYAILIIALYWAMGTALSVFAGWIMTTKVIGEGATLNGISLILLANILSSYGSDTADICAAITLTSPAVWMVAVKAAVIIIAFIGIFVFVTAGQICEKRLPVVSSAKAIDNKIATAYKSGYPIKLWAGSVVPVIFASQIFSLPGIIKSFSGSTSKAMTVIANVFDTSAWFSAAHPAYTVGALLYVLAIVGFSYYYADISTNPREVADSMQKKAQTISGYRPGRQTADYIKQQTHYVTMLGGFALAAIALVPCILGGMMGINRVSYLGTSVLITVGVIIDIGRYIKSFTRYKKERGFLHHGKTRK